MNIAAFVISLLAGLISFLQGGCATGVGAIGTGLGSRVGGYEGAKIAREGASMGGAGALIVLAALLAIIGGSFALPRKKASYWLLAVSSGMCLLAVMVSGGIYKDAYVWLTAYAIACGCAYAGCQDNQSEVKLTSNSRSEGMRPIFLSEPKRPQESPASVSSKTYEPVIGLETDALIKRAFLFLEDGEFDNAGQYLNQALNQDAEDSRIHFGLLMLEHRVHNADELIGKLATPLEDEKLFQRALRFAQGEYKSQLEAYVRASHDKLEQERIAAEALAEQKRIAEEAERERQRIEEERKRAEREAENERRYQEMLVFREKAASVNELEELWQLVYRLRPYKDTEQIYYDVNEALKTERKYQNARRELQNASGISDLKNVIASLEELDDYKDTEKLLDEAQSKLEDLEERAQKRKKVTATVCVLVAVAVGSFLGWKWHKDKEAATVRQNAITAFFEGRYDEANEAITAVISSDNDPATHAALLYVQTLMKGGTSQTFIESPDISKHQYSAPFNSSFKEASSLAEKYTHTLNGNKFLGDTYLHGWGYDKDTNKALEYFKCSAESNDIYSQLAIAEIYEGRHYIQEALKWYEKLTDSGNAQAAGKVRELKAKMIAPKPPAPRQQEITPSKDDTSTSSAMAQEWYEWGCDFLDSKNYSDAVKYFRLSANENYAPAQDKLGWMYQNGWGVTRSYSEAYKQYKKAAEQGNREAQASLGYLYYKGLGVKRDLQQALYWYGKSAEQGNTTARRQYERIERELADQSAAPSQAYSQQNFPVSGYITGNKVNVRRAPSIEAVSVNRLNSGHPVSVSRRSAEYDGDWYYVKTASGTEGWVKGDYVALNANAERTQQERENRRKSMPTRGVITVIRIGNRTGNKLNLRNIPSTARTAKVITEMTTGDEFTALERFAEEERDWYRIRTYNYEEGWVSGRYIELR